MTILPAIDLRGGRVVRLKQGKSSEETAYSDDPAGIALRWQREGASWLHVVDLDAALGEANARNAAALLDIRAAVGIPIQFGGGLRDPASVARAFQAGMDRVVIGTMAIEQPEMLGEILTQFGTDRIAVAMDSRGGRIATRGWQFGSDSDQLEFGRKMRELGIVRAIVTDIARDGMMAGIDATALAAIARDTGLHVIASGGIAGLDDLARLRRYEHDGIEGAILGQALYSGRLTIREAIQATGLAIN